MWVEMPFKFVELDPLYSVNFRGSDKTFHLYKDIKTSRTVWRYWTRLEQKYDTWKIRVFTIQLIWWLKTTLTISWITHADACKLVHLPVLFESLRPCEILPVQRSPTNSIAGGIFSGQNALTIEFTVFNSTPEFPHDGYYKRGRHVQRGERDSELEKQNENWYSTEIVDVQSDGDKVKSWLTKWKYLRSRYFSDKCRCCIIQKSNTETPEIFRQNWPKMEWTMGYLTFYVGINENCRR